MIKLSLLFLLFSVPHKVLIAQAPTLSLSPEAEYAINNLTQALRDFGMPNGTGQGLIAGINEANRLIGINAPNLINTFKEAIVVAKEISNSTVPNILIEVSALRDEFSNTFSFGKIAGAVGVAVSVGVVLTCTIVGAFRIMTLFGPDCCRRANHHPVPPAIEA